MLVVHYAVVCLSPVCRAHRYVPSSGDRQEEDVSAISDRADKLLRALHLVDTAAGIDLMRTFRVNIRKWISAVVLQPLCDLLESNQRQLVEEAAKGLGVRNASTGTSNLFAARPAAPAPTLAPRTIVTVDEWLKAEHSDLKAQVAAALRARQMVPLLSPSPVKSP